MKLPERGVGTNGAVENGASDAEGAILSATERLLEEVPLHDLSVAQIIEAAGVSRATFYFYFASKFAVVAALVKQAIDQIYHVRERLPATSPAKREAALQARIRDSLDVWDQHRAVLRATVENWHAFPELEALWLDMIGGLSEAVATEIEEERSAGRAPAGTDAQALAAALAWTTERCLYVVGLDIDRTVSDREPMLEALVQIWMHAIYGGPTAAREAAA
jgi:TetR/AcrR family transcriptional regulator, ethionamide resistance regulator